MENNLIGENEKKNFWGFCKKHKVKLILGGVVVVVFAVATLVNGESSVDSLTDAVKEIDPEVAETIVDNVVENASEIV